MKSYSTLPILVSRYIEIKKLSKVPSYTPFEIEENPLLDASLPADDPCTIPFNVFYSGEYISDGFYTAYVHVQPPLEIPRLSIIKVCHWTLDLEPKLIFNIKKVKIISNACTEKSFPTIPIERNPRVSDFLHLLHYMSIKEKVKLIPCEPSDEFGSKIVSSSFMSDAPDSQQSFEEIERPVVSNIKPVTIGTGQLSKTKADSFKQSRVVKTPQGSQDDLISTLNIQRSAEKPKDAVPAASFVNTPATPKVLPWNPKPSQQPQKQLENPIDSAIKEIGMEKFPFWALEYLSIVYKQ